MPSTIKIIKITKILLLLCFFIRIVLLEYLETLAMILKETFGCKLKSLNNDVYVTWYSSIKCYHLNIINGRQRSMCFKYCKNYYISCALSWKVKKKHGQLWQKIPWNWTRVYCMNFLSKLLSYPFVSWNNMNVLWRLRMNAKEWSTHKVFRIYLDLKILKNSSSTTLNV